jgi:hypothetical protein
MRTNLIIIFLIITCLPNYSQVISGSVFDNKTRKQIPYANVFFNGTTIGTYTDISGNFNLILPTDGKFPIAVSAIGYESILLTDYSTDYSIKVFMEPKIYKLGEVIVSSKMSLRNRIARKQNLSLFKRQFFGKSLNATQCKILNENDIILQYLDNEDILKAYSKNPLIIINKALGYHITYYLHTFECSSSGDSLKLYGNYILKDDNAMQGQKKVRAEKRRRFAYLGSRMQLFRSLWDNDLDSTGFTLKNMKNDILSYDSLVIQTDSKTKFLKRKGIVNIAYLSKWNDTQIMILKDSIYFNKFGYFDPYCINWKGVMSEQRIADLLPFDYIYKQATTKRIKKSY